MTNVSRETSPLRRWAVRRRAALGLPLLIAAALLFTGCGGVAEPKGWAGPVLDGDVMYINSRGDKLVAVSVQGRDERWRFPDSRSKDVKLEGVYGEPMIAGERLLIGAYDGNLYSLSARDGALQWIAETGGPIVGGAAVAGDVAIVGSGDGYVYAFALSDGAQRWRYKTGSRVWARPAIEGEVAYVPSLDGKVYALRVADGTSVWRDQFKADAGFPAGAAIADGLVVVGSLDKRLYALRVDDGSLAWSYKAGNWFWTTPLIQNGRVYAGNVDEKLYALNLSDGKLLWTYDAQAPLRSSPIPGEGVVIVAAKDGFVHGVRAQSGERAWVSGDLQTDLLANLALRDAQVYVRGENGALWSMSASDGSFIQIRSKG